MTKGLAVVLLAAVAAASGTAIAQNVERHTVLRYMLNGVAHYTNAAPPDGATDVTVVFTYLKFASGDTWMSVAESDKDEYFLHAESHTLKGKQGRGWILSSRLPNTDGKVEFGALSSKSRWTVDCEEMRTTKTDYIEYSDRLGRGSVTASWSGSDPWSSVVPGTVGETIAKQICKGPPKPPSNS